MDNVLSEIIGTFILVFGVIYMATPDVGLGAIQALPVAFLVFAYWFISGRYNRIRH